MELEVEFVKQHIGMLKQTSYIAFLDANNFYRWVMLQKLPVKLPVLNG